jgi:hypothetical protein
MHFFFTAFRRLFPYLIPKPCSHEYKCPVQWYLTDTDQAFRHQARIDDLILKLFCITTGQFFKDTLPGCTDAHVMSVVPGQHGPCNCEKNVSKN